MAIVRCLNCMKEVEGAYGICPECGYELNAGPKELLYIAPGTVLHERYIIGTVVGSGGFGIVYKAWDTLLSQTVAIKEYFPNGIVTRTPGNPQVIVIKREEYANGLARFLDEARRTAKFSGHPKIVNIHTFFEMNNTAYIVMEYIEGISLGNFMKQENGKLSLDFATDVVLELLEALEVIHKEKILHRDIKPGNLFLTETGAKLFDFGAARLSDTDNEKTRSIVLTPGFAPVEQYESKSKQGPYTDLYAVGALFYFMVTGKKPDESTDRAVEDNMPEPKELVPGVPDYINNIIMRAMSINPALRFQTASEFRNAIMAHKEVRKPKEELKHRKKKRGWIIGGVTVAILALALVCLYIYWDYMCIVRKGTISVWIPYDEQVEAFLENGKECPPYTTVIKMFEEDYPKVKVEYRFIDESVYRDELVKALEEGNGPDLYMSSYLTEEENNKYAISAKKVLRLINPNEYYLIDTYMKSSDGKAIPVALDVPVLYTNKVKTEGMSYQEMWDCAEAGIADYQNWKSYAGRFSDYRRINAYGSKYYSYDMYYTDEGQPYSFASVWSINSKASRNSKNAAYRMVTYFLSSGNDGGQAKICVVGKLGLPLSKSVFEEMWNGDKQHLGSDKEFTAKDCFEKTDAEFDVFYSK